jgi:hypothetical protein
MCEMCKVIAINSFETLPLLCGHTVYLMNSTNTPSCLSWHTQRFWVQDLDWICHFCISFPRLAQWPGFSPGLSPLFISLHEPNVPSSLWRGVPAAVKLSLPQHATSILLTSTKVYGYKVNMNTSSAVIPNCTRGLIIEIQNSYDPYLVWCHGKNWCEQRIW